MNRKLKQLAEEAIEPVLSVFWANTFDEEQLKADITKLFKKHLIKAKPCSKN
jgi:hypothetical protein